MKTPPLREEQLRSQAVALPESNGRLLVLAALILMALAAGFKADFIQIDHLWPLLGAGLVVIAVPTVFTYLRREAGSAPPVEHYAPAAMGAVAVAGLAAQLSLYPYLAAVGLFGAGFYVATVLDRRRLRDRLKPGQVIVQEIVLGLSLAGGYLVVLSNLQENKLLQLLWISVLTLLATYRAFRVLGHSMSPRRGLFFSFMVAQVVVFLAGAITYIQYAQVGPGMEAVMLFLAWYINRGLVQHTVEETLSRQIFLEYAAFGAVLVYLFFASMGTPR